jgi:hypothetical protein
MGEIPHDLVVPTASATAWGKAQPAFTCSHSHYFLEHDVRAAIRNF